MSFERVFNSSKKQLIHNKNMHLKCDKRSRRKSFFFQKSGFFWPFTVVVYVSSNGVSPFVHVIGALLRLLPSY